MQKLSILAFLVISMSCDDGDLQIEIIDFDDESIEVCDENPVEAEEENILFKINDTEAIILELSSDAILNEVSTEPIELSVSSSGDAQITYRSFSDTVTSAYFCDDIPVTTPIVIEEILAESGSVFISTVLSEDELNYEHTITLSAISLITSDNTRVTDLSINDFGSVTTLVPTEEEE